MKITPIKTPKFLPPKDDLSVLLRAAFSDFELKQESIVAFTSKVVAISQGRCIKIDAIKDKDGLIKKEADFYLERDQVPGNLAMLTIKNNVLLPTAGIDESNANGFYVLWPKEPYRVAKDICLLLRERFGLQKLGVIITDSHCVPLRRGTIGVCIGFYGFQPLNDYRGTKDIFGRRIRITQANIADALAVAAACSMGEGAEQTPLAVIEDIPFVEFAEKEYNEKNNPLLIPKEEDMYRPLLEGVEWKIKSKIKKDPTGCPAGHQKSK